MLPNCREFPHSLQNILCRQTREARADSLVFTHTFTPTHGNLRRGFEAPPPSDEIATGNNGLTLNLHPFRWLVLCRFVSPSHWPSRNRNDKRTVGQHQDVRKGVISHTAVRKADDSTTRSVVHILESVWLTPARLSHSTSLHAMHRTTKPNQGNGRYYNSKTKRPPYRVVPPSLRVDRVQQAE